MSGNPNFSCANVGAGTSCCTGAGLFNNNCGEGLSGGPCYTPPPPCTYAATACAAGSTCPGGTAVSAECADRSAFGESPCACTALQELAALSANLATEAPWNDLAIASYCTGGLVGDYDYDTDYNYDTDYDPTLEVKCATSGGVQVPARVTTTYGDLTGALPPSLGELGPPLTYLDLGTNAITSVPTELAALTGLTYLALDRNDLTSVPTELWALTGLKFLTLGTNAISSVPTELAALTGLTYLALDRNAISSVPTEVGTLTGLTWLGLQEIGITSVPTEVGALTGLTFLDLSYNDLTSVPTELAALTGLSYLYLGSNQLTGVPTEFRTVDPSIACSFSVNPGFSCANLGAGTSCCNRFSCSDTATCYGSTCTYADTACAAGSTCPGGTAVSAECADRSAFGESPCACTALQELAALSHDLQAEVPWADLASAAYCQIGDLTVDCATVDGVQLPTYVNGYNVGVAGALPPSLGELGPLVTNLYLGTNAITSVPTELGALTGLRNLALDFNAITSVPTEIGALTGLEILVLYNNAITSLPTEIGALTGLTILRLDNNAITSVPTELGALTSLFTLDLYANQLTGVPTEFRTWGPSQGCTLFANPNFSCANVGVGTSCCNTDNCGSTVATCYRG